MPQWNDCRACVSSKRIFNAVVGIVALVNQPHEDLELNTLAKSAKRFRTGYVLIGTGLSIIGPWSTTHTSAAGVGTAQVEFGYEGEHKRYNWLYPNSFSRAAYLARQSHPLLGRLYGPAQHPLNISPRVSAHDHGYLLRGKDRGTTELFMRIIVPIWAISCCKFAPSFCLRCRQL